MPTRKATAEWKGTLELGKGNITFGNGRFDEAYTAGSRFENEEGTNPEELIAAAHAACFSMALSHELAEAGTPAASVRTEAGVELAKQGDGFAINTITLTTEAKVPDIDNERFQAIAKGAKAGCPVSKALAGCEIHLDAQLVS